MAEREKIRVDLREDQCELILDMCDHLVSRIVKDTSTTNSTLLMCGEFTARRLSELKELITANAGDNRG